MEEKNPQQERVFSSSIGHERQTNPFLCQPNVEAFVDLKRNWLADKLAHGMK